MATITSPGMASGLPIKDMVAQLVALERAPLTGLQTQVNKAQSKLSLYGTIKSLVTSLGDAGARLSEANTFKAVKATSSVPDVVGVTVAAGTPPTGFSLEVQRLAQAVQGGRDLVDRKRETAAQIERRGRVVDAQGPDRHGADYKIVVCREPRRLHKS